MEISGQVTKVLEVQKGTAASGKEWQKVTFVIDTKEDYNNVLAFEIFGDDKVENFLKYNKVGSKVKVDFNIKCNEWQGKYFTSLDAWKVFKAEDVGDEPKAAAPQPATVPEEDLPF